jgi:hypothetical protein
MVTQSADWSNLCHRGSLELLSEMSPQFQYGSLRAGFHVYLSVEDLPHYGYFRFVIAKRLRQLIDLVLNAPPSVAGRRCI